MIGRIGVGALALFATGCLTYGREAGTETVSESEAITRVEIDIDAGDVSIATARNTPGARGAVDSRWSDAAPEVLHYVSDGVLHVIGRCDALAIACRTDVTLEVAADVSVGAQTAMGDIDISGVTGDVDAGTEDGDIALHDIRGTLFVESGSGAIAGDQLAGTIVDARTRSGDVELEVTGAPQRIVARTDAGDVNLLVPAGAYRIQADAPAGDLVLGETVRDDATAQAVIVADTRNGDVRIEGGSVARQPAEPKGGGEGQHAR
jgi:DUF4097 and DUF4098 domain-containing protein YvlB